MSSGQQVVDFSAAVPSTIKRNISLDFSLDLSKQKKKRQCKREHKYQFSVSRPKERLNRHTTTNGATLNSNKSEREINRVQRQVKHTSFLPTTVGMDHIWKITISWHTSQTVVPASREMHFYQP